VTCARSWDNLTLAKIFELYHLSKLAKYLQIRPSQLPDVMALFGEPFKDADATLALVEA
jgi:hypothetical protein